MSEFLTMSAEPRFSESGRSVYLVSDGAEEFRSAALPLSNAIDNADVLWVVERTQSLDTTDLQEQVLESGRDVLVCSFLRSSVAEIGPCRHYVGSMASVSSAAGITVHCEHDLGRAARELRGRLAARTVSVILDGYLLTFVTQGTRHFGLAGRSLADVLDEIAAIGDRSVSAA